MAGLSLGLSLGLPPLPRPRWGWGTPTRAQPLTEPLLCLGQSPVGWHCPDPQPELGEEDGEQDAREASEDGSSSVGASPVAVSAGPGLGLAGGPGERC